jgi:plasmid stability protein
MRRAKTLTVRNVDEGLIRKLKLRAARHGRSAESELRDIIAMALAAEPREDFWSLAAKVRKLSQGPVQIPSERLQRETRGH